MGVPAGRVVPLHPALCLLGAAALFVLAGWPDAVLAQEAAQEAAREAEAPKPAPPVVAMALDGEVYDLEALRGRVVVVNFWFVDCPPCRGEIPDLNALVADYRARDVVFLAFALDDAPALRAFLAETPFDYAVFPEAHDVARQFRVFVYPTHLLIDRQGRIAHRLTGGDAGRQAEIRSLLDGLLGGE